VSQPGVDQMRHVLEAWRVSPMMGCELVVPLDPLRDHIVGNPAAPIGVLEYGCYGSPSGCREDRAFRAPLRGVLEQGRSCFALRHFPLIDANPHAWLASCAAEAAACQGRFWDLHEAISEALAQSSSTGIELSTIIALARELGLDADRLLRDMEAPATAERILGDFHGGVKSGVNGTPTFYVAGIRQVVDTPEQLLARLERALAGDLAALWPPHHSTGVRAPA
jgi:protein-disulfide isomerase